MPCWKGRGLDRSQACDFVSDLLPSLNGAFNLQLFSWQAVDVGAAIAPTATVARLINVDNMVRSRVR